MHTAHANYTSLFSQLHYSVKQNRLFIDDQDCSELGKQYGTPLHVVSRSKLNFDITTFLRSFPLDGTLEAFFAYKANSIPGVLRDIHMHGFGAEVISPFELWLALKLGVPAEKIIYNGAVKPDEGLQTAIQQQIRQINVDSSSELMRIAHLARSYNVRTRIGLRVSPAHGWTSHFGITPHEIISKAMPFILSDETLDLRGLMIHSGTRATDHQIFIKNINMLISLAGDIKRRFSFTLDNIDIGGGFGVPTIRGLGLKELILYRVLRQLLNPPNPHDTMPIGEAGKAIGDYFLRMRGELGLPQLRLFVEPGRSVVSSSHTLLLRVYEIKQIRNRKYVITDGGRFNCTFPMEHELHFCFVANRPCAVPSERYTVMGRVCSPGDWVYMQVELPKVERGDILAIADSGAYFTQFSNNFCYPRPAVLMVDGDSVRFLRQHETYEHIVGMDLP